MIKAMKIARLGLGGAIFGYALVSAIGPLFNAPDSLGLVGWVVGLGAATLGAIKAAAVA